MAGHAQAQMRPGAADRAKELNQQAPRQAASTTPPPRPPPIRPAPSTPARPASAARIIQHIVVRGTQRVEPGTVLTYVGIREGDNYTPPMSTPR